MKPNYKNWVPKILIVGMGLATAVSITALIVFGICGLLVTQTCRIILGILFAVTTVGCGKTLQWSITAYRAFSYNGTRQFSRKTKTCNLTVPTMFCAPSHERSKCKQRSPNIIR